MARIRGYSQKDRAMYRYRLILDIGTEYLKAVLVEYEEEEVNVIGFAKLKQRHGDMEGGLIADIDGVVLTARAALKQVCLDAPQRPRDLVIGIAGSFVKGVSTTIESERRFPKKYINKQELLTLTRKATQRGINRATEILSQDTGQNHLEVSNINSTLTAVKVDGFRVANPLHFWANKVSVTVFNTFCPMAHLGALKSLARGLKLPLAGTVAEPYAVISSILGDETIEFGALAVDIGGGTIDIGLIRNGGIEATEMLALGGRAFTRSLAHRFNISLQEAEALKINYSKGTLNEDLMKKVKPTIERDLSILYQGLEAAMVRLARDEILPQHIYFCGGGCALEGLMEGMKDGMIFQRLAYFDNPKISFLKGEDIKGLGGREGALLGVENVTPRALALEGVKLKVKPAWPLSQLNFLV